MSLDILFVPPRLSDAASEGGGVTSKVPMERPRRPLSRDAVAALLKLLTGVCPKGPDQNACYAVEFDDGGFARVDASNLTGGCKVSLRSLTPDVCRFLHSFLQAGGWVMLPMTDPKIAITSNEDPETCIADGCARIVCATCDDLSIVLVVGLDAWQNYSNNS
jgi:hypothetical protein